MSSEAFCPGHITGFFTISEDTEQSLESVGSRGAGFSIELGAHTEVEVEGDGWEIEVNGEPTSFPVVEKTLYNFAKGGRAMITTEVPFSQGLGMSGACALSAGLAVLSELGKKTDQAIKAAHVSEVFCRTGLGDVVAQAQGGFEIRKGEGFGGEIDKKEIEEEVVIAILGEPLVTPGILGNPMMEEWIKAVGNDCMDEFLPEDGFDRFLDISLEFAEETGFLKDWIGDVLDETKEYGAGSMCMIGNSIFCFGDTDEIKGVLEENERVEELFVTEIDNEGSRIL